jgi:hemolysin III
MAYLPKHYAPSEERLNVWSHGIGLILSIVATIALLRSALLFGTVWHLVAYTIYGASQIAIFTASTLYHNAKRPEWRYRLNIFDHAAIYLSIAGTYTPFTLISIRGPWGWSVFVTVWLVALAGIILKLYFTGRFKLLSTIGYVAMGWIIVIAIKPLINNVPFEGLIWLAGGGILYMVGAVLYQIKSIPYNHAIFHFFVLAAAMCHFISIFVYTI